MTTTEDGGAMRERRGSPGRARRRVVVLITALALASATFGAVPGSNAAVPPVEVLSVDNSGAPLLRDNIRPSLSVDGQIGAFWEPPPALATARLFSSSIVRDRGAGATVAVPLPRQDVSQLVVARDGCHLAYTTNGSGLFQVGVWNRCDPASTPVTISAFAPSTFGADELAISSFGRLIAVRTSDGAMHRLDRDPDGNGVLDDTVPSDAALPSSSTFGTYNAPSLGDENLTRVVATTVTRPNGQPGIQVVLWNADVAVGGPGRLTVVSVATDASMGDQTSMAPSMTPDGRFVAFASYATNLVPVVTGVTTAGPQIYVRDMANGVTRLVSRRSDGVPGSGSSVEASISDDGTQIAFITDAPDLLPPLGAGACVNDNGDGGCLTGDVLVGRSTSGFYGSVAFDRADVRPDGSPPDMANGGFQGAPWISGNGRWVAWSTAFAFQLTGAKAFDGRTHAVVVQRPGALAISPLDAGAAAVNTTAGPFTVQVTNTGLSSVRLAPFTTTGNFAVAAGGDCAVGAWLSPGTSCSVAVTFTPKGAGTRNGTLDMTEPGYAPVSASATLTGTGTVTVTTTPPVTKGKLSITPTPADFGTVTVTVASPAVLFTVTNTGNAAVNVNGPGLGGAVPGDYVITSESCTGATLAPADSCVVSLQFKPTDAGPRDVKLTVTGSGGTSATATVTGTGLFGPVLRLVPNVVPQGQVTRAYGGNFPPSITLTLRWSNRPGTITVTTDIAGRFQRDIAIRPDEPTGPRKLLVDDVPGEFSGVFARAVVVLPAVQPPMANNPAFPGVPFLVIRG